MTMLYFSVNGTVSKVDYIPRTMLDYGTLLCWAENNTGSQSQPCVFHLIPAQPPAPINDCSISHRDTSSVGVTCHTQTRDSDVSLTFVLELWRTGDVNIIRNLSSSSGDWRLESRRTDTRSGISDQCVHHQCSWSQS